MLGEQALPYVPPLRLSLEPAGSLLEQLFQAVCFSSLCPLAKRDRGRIILSVLRTAVSILHSARLLRFGLLQASCVRSLAGLLPSALSLRAGESPAGKPPWLRLAGWCVPWPCRGAGVELCLVCAAWKSATKTCRHSKRLGASPRSDPWGWRCPHGRPKGWHCCGEARACCISLPTPVSPSRLHLFFPQRFKPLIYAKARSCSPCACLPFPWGSSSAGVQGAGLGIEVVVLCFVINRSVPRYPTWGKKKRGWTPFWKAAWDLCTQRGATLSRVSLRIWPLTLSFPFSSYTGKVEVMLESLLGSRAFFP